MSAELPNPFTPLAFLPPNVAHETNVAAYILVGSLGALVWELLITLNDDYRLLTKHRISFPTFVYFLSRVSNLAYVLISTIFETAPVGHCHALERTVDILYPVAVASTSLLFFLRIRAIFNRNPYTVAFFFFLWLSVLAGGLTILTAVTAINIGPTPYCLNASLKPYASAAAITALVHDTLVFLAISWRLNSHVDVDFDFRTQAKSFITGEYLPSFSRALLKDGQLYYLITICSNALTLIMVFVTSVPTTYRTMFTVPNLFLTNSMACRVFRSTKFGLIKDTTISSTTLSAGTERGGAPIPLRFRPQATRNTDAEFGAPGREGSSVIHVTKTVEQVHYNESDESKSQEYRL